MYVPLHSDLLLDDPRKAFSIARHLARYIQQCSKFFQHQNASIIQKIHNSILKALEKLMPTTLILLVTAKDILNSKNAVTMFYFTP